MRQHVAPSKVSTACRVDVAYERNRGAMNAAAELYVCVQCVQGNEMRCARGTHMVADVLVQGHEELLHGVWQGMLRVARNVLICKLELDQSIRC